MDKLRRIHDAEGRAIAGGKNLAERLKGIANACVQAVLVLVLGS